MADTPLAEVGTEAEGLMKNAKNAKNAIQVLMRGEHDWLVREDGGGRELGHYPTRREAEAVGHKLARKRRVEPKRRTRPRLRLEPPCWGLAEPQLEQQRSAAKIDSLIAEKQR